MPLYEYECTACGERTELIQRLADAPLAECPVCGKTVKKLLSAPSFQFKGSGWYVTDYGGKGSGSKEGSDSSASEKTSSNSEKSSSETEKSSSKTEKSSSEKATGTKKDGSGKSGDQ